MKKKILTISIFVSIIYNYLSFGQMATNPLIYADVPDPDILRVGSNYYMTSTTMHMNPGVPIMKSTDLVNWSIVNYAYTTLASTDALNLNKNLQAYSGGSWASSISYNKGMYYVTTFSYTTGKTYIFKTTDIEKGPWTSIILNKVYHDHSLFFDEDGKVYMAYGHDDIQLTEMNADLSGEKVGGVNKIIITKASSVAGTSFILTAEGTHLQKINGIYYVSNICWPNGKGRTQTIWKSNTLTGGYIGKVAFQSTNGAAQGEYVDTPTGKWYALFFQDNGSVGRIPDLMPVTWGADGWPTVGVNGQVPATLDIPKGSGSIRGIIDSDEFSVAAPLKLQWQWNHNPNYSFWSLTQKTGFLRLTNERTDPNVLHTTNTLTQRTYGPKCSGYVAMDVSGMKDGDYAGLLALQNKYGFVGVKMSGSTKSLIMSTATGFDGATTEVGNITLNQNTVYFRIDFDFTNKTDKANFFYSLNGTTWTPIGSTLQMTYDLTHFMGYRFGLFTYATKSSGGYTDFDYFRVGANITEAQNSGTTNVAPTVSLTSPVNNSSFTSPATIAIAATAADADGTVSSVAFYNGNTLLGTDATSPYGFSWSGVGAGTYSITARATDNSGAVTTSSAVSVTVTAPVNVAPTVSLTSPVNNSSFTSPATIAIAATAADADGTVSSVAFYNGTTLLGTDATSPYGFSWSGVGAGTYSITARATDNSGAVTTSTAVSVTVTGVANVAPIVSLTAPANNASYTAPATIAITAVASDSDGTVSSVAFYNGTTLLGTDATSPYSFNWTGVGAGTYSITAKATDNSGAVTTSSAVSVTVTAPVNVAPTVSLTSPLNNASFTSPATISIAATASDADGTVSSVAFYNGTTLLGTDATSPYSFSWTGVVAGTYSITARATDNSGAVTTSGAVSVVVTNPTSTADIIGVDCGSNNVTLSFQLNSSKRANVTSYNWWYTGSVSSTTPVAGAPYSVSIQTGGNFSAGQVCVGANLSVAPWYVQYCKSITKCAAKLGEMDNTETDNALLVYPNPSNSEFELIANRNIIKIQVSNEIGELIYEIGKIEDGRTLKFGQNWASGIYSVLILHTDGHVSEQKLVKVK